MKNILLIEHLKHYKNYFVAYRYIILYNYVE